jgi:hypothetical protein
MPGQDSINCMKLKTRVKDKVMLILVDSGSTHSFISSHFVNLTQLPIVPIPPKRVKLANGQWLVTDKMVKNLECYCQGQHFATDMVVLDMHPYDAILGYDWLKTHSPMECDWNQKTLQFSEQGRTVKLQGLTYAPMQLSAILATKVYNATKGNDIWAFVLLDHAPPHAEEKQPPHPDLADLLLSYKDVFNDPQILPLARAYDHAIPLLPGATPINARPYHYSPMHKTEIEKQVQQLLQASLIVHSHNPFASPVLLVKKRWQLEILCGL